MAGKHANTLEYSAAEIMASTIDKMVIEGCTEFSQKGKAYCQLPENHGNYHAAFSHNLEKVHYWGSHRD